MMLLLRAPLCAIRAAAAMLDYDRISRALFSPRFLHAAAFRFRRPLML